MDDLRSYIPHVSKEYELKQLRRLPVPLQCKLALKWFKKIGSSNKNIDKNSFIQQLNEFIDFKIGRREVSSTIVNKFWPKGLTIQQLAQIDSSILLQHSSHYQWNSQTLLNSHNLTNYTPPLNKIFKMEFMYSLQSELSKTHLCHINSFLHHTLPIWLVRIQLYDKNLANLETNKLVSRTPFYVAFVQNSPTIIHSPGNDPFFDLIIQCLKRALSNRELIHMKPNETEPVRDLANIFITSGASRYSESMGRWSDFASKSKTDISPLSDLTNHNSIKGRDVTENKIDTEIKSMLKFKGTNGNKNDYASLVPTERVNFTLNNQNNNGDTITLKFRFKGEDIFGGLHKLCDQSLIDVDKVPGWLAGENGVHSGIIENGDFIKEDKPIYRGLP